MQIARRHLAVGALALSAVSLSSGTASADAEVAAVDQAAEALRQAMLAADKAKLEALIAEELSYGHSSGRVESKADFLAVVAGKKTIYKSITLSDASTKLAGGNAIVRNIFAVETESDGKPSSAKVGVMQVWQKQGSAWRLLARQAFKLA